MSTIDRAAAALYDAINSLPGPGRVARLAAALLVTPFAAAAPSLSRRTTTALIANPSFDTFPHPVPEGNFVHRCDNTTGVLSLGTKGVTVCDLTSSSCHTLPDPSGSTFTGRVVLEHGDAALPCNSLFFGQSYTDAGGSQVRVGKYTGSGFTVQGSSPASSGANQLTTSSIGVNGNRDKFYIGSGFAGTTENGYLVTRLDSDGSNGISWHKEDTHLSSSGRVVEPNVYAISWVNQNGSWLSVVEFALNSETSNSMTARVKSGNFATTQSINVPSSSTALTKLQTQNLPNEQFLSAAIGNGSVDGPMIHLNLLHMPAESKIPTKLDSSDLSLTSVDHISISPPDASGTTKLYWSSGGVVSVADISIVNNALTITGQATLFDLGNVTLDGLSTTTYQNGKQVVAYGLSGQTKVWVGDVIVPATTSPAPAATTAAVSGGVPFSVGGGLQSQAHMCGDVAHFQMGPGGSDQYDVCPVTSGSVLNGCQSVNPVAGSSGSGPVYFANRGEVVSTDDGSGAGNVVWPLAYDHPCNGTYWAQKYTSAQGDRLRIGVTEADGSLTELASDLQVGNSASFNITSASVYSIPNDSRQFLYVSSTRDDGGGVEYGLNRFIVEGDGSGVTKVQEKSYTIQPSSSEKNVVAFSAPYTISDTGSNRAPVIRFEIDNGKVVITRASKFISAASETPTTFATASAGLDNLKVQYLQKDSYIIAAVGDQGTVHVGLADGVRFWDGSMSVSSVIDVAVSGITALSLAVDPTNRENAYVYWAEAGKVYSMQVRTSEGQVSTSTPVTVFDLGAVNVDQLSTGIYQNGKHAITYEVGGVPKAWVGDVIVPATTSPAPAATTAAVSGASVDGGGGTSGGGMVVTAVPAVTGGGSGGPVIGGAQGSDGGSSMMGIVAGVVAGAVLLAFAVIVAVWRRRGHSDRKSLLNFNNSDIDRRRLGGASETSMDEAAAVHAGMMSGGVLGSGPPPAVPERGYSDEDEEGLYGVAPVREETVYVGGLSEAERQRRLNEKWNPSGGPGGSGVYQNGGVYEPTPDQNGDGTYVNEDYGKRGRRRDLHTQRDDGSVDLQGDDDGKYANRAGVNEWEREAMQEMGERLRRGRNDSGTSNPLDVSGSSGGGDTSSSDPESPPVAAAPQPPGWMGPTASRASIHV